jgi:Domain of unknown function (4846)
MTHPTSLLAALLLVVALAAVACRSASGDEPPPPPAASATALAIATATPSSKPPSMPAAPDYPWKPRSADRLDARFPAPSGFSRVAVDAASFGAFLRALPLLPAGSPVVDYRDRLVRAGDDPRIAAVVDIDIGTSDLQQCADAVLRMNAEWRYSRGERDMTYPVSSGAMLSYPRYLAGERAFASGNKLLTQPSAARMGEDHRAFRGYLDEVFTWANTTSLEREGAPVPFAELRPGDFFVMLERPYGHAVLVLDVARNATGDVAMLLGQSYMPAQSFQVLRPFGQRAWFVVRPGMATVATPFWDPFPLSSLRRLP